MISKLPLILLLIIIILLFLGYHLYRNSFTFIIYIKNNKVKVLKGQPPISFIEECSEITTIYKTLQGHIMGYQDNGQTRLKFSKSLENYAQIFRNVWH